jgi:isoleucyl-tRNA synthetase
MAIFKEYKELNLSKIHKEILLYWEENNIFQKSIENRKNGDEFVFYEGPPSANGMPGIHHVMARTIKDLFCRYKTLKGFKVGRKAGWDTHGLPVELGVEKELNITKEDIGTTISIKDYNDHCRKNVMKYKANWEEVTKEMGYWVDMKSPYVTYENKYIESVWWLLSTLHKKKLLYKGKTIQPFSPKAGTGLSSHELNQPGCYRTIKDTTVIAQFKLLKNNSSEFLFKKTHNDIYFLAWTTTPWTLPSNTALAVGRKINYLLIDTINQYTGKKISIVIAKDLSKNFFKKENQNLNFEDYVVGDKELPYKIIDEINGEALEKLDYEQLLPYAKPKEGKSFVIILADFVTTDEGTGIVHIAPSFGSDDSLVAKQNNIGSLTLVNKQGRFVDAVTDFAGMYVKNEYYTNDDEAPKLSADIQITIKLKKENRCFHSEKYEHSYPHCWRTDKPILYYPLDSWFIKTTDYKNKMIALNSTINWKPESTGKGRFGNWLENLVDWNLSRSRFWGIPLPIWKTECENEELCVDSIQELKLEIDKSIIAGFMKKNPLENFIPNDFSEKNYSLFDLHRPYVDDIILVSEKGLPMKREMDLIDVWFDSGAMPFAQLHYPFENKDLLNTCFPADFIAEGVDQTRGWFFTLHAISSMLFDSPSYKNVISNGLVLDKDGNKMSKRLGNAVDPLYILNKYGADATRWYMISNAQPWDNLKFNEKGIEEVKRKFFGTLYNTYSFFALYANIDNFNINSVTEKSEKELDKWIISELNTLIKDVKANYEEYEPTRVARAIQDFVINKLSNWYIRLSRRRFWKGEYNSDKVAAYQTLYECLEKIAIISSPISPFFMDNLFIDLTDSSNSNSSSVHLSDFPEYCESLINEDLQNKMRLAQSITTLALSLRKKERIRVRQPLNKIMIPVLSKEMRNNIEEIEKIILTEINVKKIEYLNPSSEILIKKIKPNFKSLGPKYGGKINSIVAKINDFKSEDIEKIQREKKYVISDKITIDITDVEISSGDIPGHVVANNDDITVALDIKISTKLKEEGLARELVNRIQSFRKEQGFRVTDKISIKILNNEPITSAVKNNLTYICDETLTTNLEFVNKDEANFLDVNLTDSIMTRVYIKNISHG